MESEGRRKPEIRTVTNKAMERSGHMLRRPPASRRLFQRFVTFAMSRFPTSVVQGIGFQSLSKDLFDRFFSGSFGPEDISRDLVDTQEVTERKQEGVEWINEFEVVKDLGMGSFGTVKLVRDSKSGDLYAMKVFDKEKLRNKWIGATNMLEDVEKEIKILKLMDHPNCIKLYEVLDNPENEKLFLRLEYCEGGQSMLFDAPLISRMNTWFSTAPFSMDQISVEPLSEDTARRYFIDLLDGLEYMHDNNIIHRDIKPENLLLTKDGKVKLADFGTGQVLSEGEDTIAFSPGTPAFLAPEACRKGQYSGRAADIWAAGVTLYTFLHGRSPFICANPLQIYKMIREEPIGFSSHLSPDCRDLLRRLLDKDFRRRIKMKEIREHPWILQGSAE
ncbi:hypothetical protein GUITHDRAFT_104079 [Guillardia theta CCMP2712]|uniref:Protein kinase domain-containing protein n=1 Tax=Guillardia theta (strain CCMP2712) TaxID=905079 RepID=L1JPT4_GUITC|nr:hypothetical protein GUITHDRAFT_104079 [Guillardia theta CCMP2712]EKX50264.1 hypothetical protein GUITHDRAFT_104079 [Guillardia theta CCMP2712]|eukprot:XP_005837244.1 hypothetical protein GUITHDRAFT_104079 [Guillardia theta CCMP2712]